MTNSTFVHRANFQSMDGNWRWRARPVNYWSGTWPAVSKLIPTFGLADFRATTKGPANPHIRVVVRQPISPDDAQIPVGTVSKTYRLAQHHEVIERCFAGMSAAGVSTNDLRCELGLTELGEWMNFRIYFPERFQQTPEDGKPIGLRLEVFNSVDGTSRLVLLLGWLRFVCTNGMIIGETKQEFRDTHDQYMNLDKIPPAIQDGMGMVEQDIGRLNLWQQTEVSAERVTAWANGPLSQDWGKKAACRVLHICLSGEDGKIVDPFAKGAASEKPWVPELKVPGAPSPARTLYDVSQALSWVAEKRTNPEDRRDWQGRIPQLVQAV